jgi:hypothetical protein
MPAKAGIHSIYDLNQYIVPVSLHDYRLTKGK